MPFPQFRDPLDPNGQLDYLFKVATNTGETLVSATVDFVDTNDVVRTTDVPTFVGSPTLGLISTGLYGITVWLNGANAAPGQYLLRCRGVSDSVPPRKFDITMILIVKHT